jgi:hypothetical protein
MLAELSEADATGDVANIYAEIRQTCAVPYVSSLQRHLATRPGWLEWAWHAIRPAFINGWAQEAAWSAAATLQVPGLPPLSASALRVFGVDEAGVEQLRTVCETFVRVSPTNLMFSALTRVQLARASTSRPKPIEAPSWQPPVPLPPLPALVDFESLDAATAKTLMQLGNQVAGESFVPGIYRMLANWPQYMAHVATVLGPHFEDPKTTHTCTALLNSIDHVAAEVAQRLPPPDGAFDRPDESELADVIAAMEQYRKTSPEMVVFGTMLCNTLPAPP